VNWLILHSWSLTLSSIWPIYSKPNNSTDRTFFLDDSLNKLKTSNNSINFQYNCLLLIILVILSLWDLFDLHTKS
jgi:hypothetical protein